MNKKLSLFMLVAASVGAILIASNSKLNTQYAEKIVKHTIENSSYSKNTAKIKIPSIDTVQSVTVDNGEIISQTFDKTFGVITITVDNGTPELSNVIIGDKFNNSSALNSYSTYCNYDLFNKRNNNIDTKIQYNIPNSEVYSNFRGIFSNLNRSMSTFGHSQRETFSYNITVAYNEISTYTEDKTIDKTIVNNVIETSCVIDVPYAKKIKSVVVDNGEVTDYFFDKTKGKVEVIVNNGTASENGTSNIVEYQNFEVTSETTSIPLSKKYYSENGYSGYLNLVSYEEKERFFYTPPATILMRSQGEALCISSSVLTSNPNYKYSLPESDSNPKFILSQKPIFHEVTSYTDHSYLSGTIENGTIKFSRYDNLNDVVYFTLTYNGTTSDRCVIWGREKTEISDVDFNPTYSNGYKRYEAGKHYIVKYFDAVFKDEIFFSSNYYLANYSGTLSKTVTVPNKSYIYNIKVTYEEDVLDLNLSQDPIEWTNGDVNIKASSTSEFFSNFTLSDESVVANPGAFNVSSNGIYSVTVKDGNHGRLQRNLTKSIQISNIDKIVPSGSFSPYSNPTWGNHASVVFTPFDSGGSGVKQWRYCVSTNDGISYGAYSLYYTTNSGNIFLSGNGRNKIKVEVVDNAGNKNEIISGSYYIDSQPPYNLIFSPNGCEWRNSKISVAWSGMDSASGIKSYKYRVKNVLSGVTTYTAWSSDSLTNTSTIIDAEGLNQIEVIVTDNAGNKSAFTSQIFNVDFSAPTFNVTLPETILNKSFIVTLSNVTDYLSGVKSIDVSLFQDFSQKVNVNYSSSISLYNVSVPTWDLIKAQTLYIRATDTAGNVKLYTTSMFITSPLPSPPSITLPIDNTLIVNSEKLTVEWTPPVYGEAEILKKELIFEDKKTKKTYIKTFNGSDYSVTFEPPIPDGVYDLSIKLYSSTNMTTESLNKIQIRKNKFKKEGAVYSKEISYPGKIFKYVNVDLKLEKQSLDDLKTHADIYIILPDNNGVFNIDNTDNIIEYTLNSVSKSLKIPGNGVNKIMVLVKMKSDDKEYSRITPWLDGISVSVR